MPLKMIFFLSRVQLGQDNSLYLVVMPLYSSLICNMNSVVLPLKKQTNKQIVRNTLLKCPEKENSHDALHVNCLTIVMEFFQTYCPPPGLQ